MSTFRPPGSDQPKKKTEERSTETPWRIDAWYKDLGPALPILKKFGSELLLFNKTLNLVGSGTLPVLDQVHFADSVESVRIIHSQIGDHEIFDIGSGNGFPGIVYAILFPKASVKLVEQDSRKAEFLRTVGHRLNLQNLVVLERSFETLPQDSVTYAMARGFAAIPKALLLARKVIKVGGKFFHIKGTEWPLEIAEMPTQLCSFWSSGLVSEYSWPSSDSKFAVVSSQKIKN